MQTGATLIKRQRLFYGWRIVALGFTNNLFAVGIATYGFGVFIKPMTDDPSLQWTRTEVVVAFTVSGVIATLMGPWIGIMLDKEHGARLITVFIGVAAAVGLALLGAVQELWQLYLFFGILVAAFAHDPPFLITSTTISKWFIRRRGVALALGSLGLSIGGLVFVPIVDALISAFGWRTSWVILGISMAVIIVPAHGLWMRRRPEDIGLYPDGVEYPRPVLEGPQSSNDVSDPEISWTMKAAMRTLPFWLLLLTYNISLAGGIGVLVNHVAYLEDELANDTLAVAAVTVFFLATIVGKLPPAVLANRIAPKYMTIGLVACCTLGMGALIGVNAPLAFVYAILFGMGWGGIEPLISLLWASYFGRAFLGAIRGFVTVTNLVSFAGAPLFASFMFDATGDYRNAFMVFLAGFSLSAVLLFLLRSPAPPQSMGRSLVTA